MTATTPAPLLRIDNLTVHYGAAQALFGLDLQVAPGETVALVGANGAGKTSLLKAIMGLAPPSGGRIFLDGVKRSPASPPRPWPPWGVALCPEGREMFGDLTVRENLELGALALRLGRPEMARRLEEVFARFPPLGERVRPAHQYPFRRGAADGGHGPGPHGPTPAPVAGRAFPGSRPPHHRRDLRHHQAAHPGRRDHPPGGAKRRPGPHRIPAPPIFWPTAASSARAEATNSWWTRNCAGPSWARVPTTTRRRPAWAPRDSPISDWRNRI